MSPRVAVPMAAALAAMMFAIPSPCLAGPWLPQPGEFVSDVRGYHLSNGGHLFDDNGDEVDYPFVEEGREIRSINEIGWKRSVSVLLSVPVRSVTHRTESPAASRTATGLADMVFGMRFRILEGRTALAIETDWKLPLGYERDVAPSLGDGLHHFSAEADFGMAIPAIQGFAQASLGYLTHVDVHVNPMGDTQRVGSDMMVYDADLGVWAGNSVLLAARYSGFSASAKDSADVDHNSHAVGPEIRYRIDDHLEVYTGASFDIAGRNTFKTKAFYLGLAVKHTRLDRLQGFLGGARRP